MSEELYRKNIESMRSRYEDIVLYLDSYCPETDGPASDKDITASVTDVCGKTVLIAYKGDTVYQFDSLYDSAPLLDLWFNGLKDEWELGSKLFMFGLGNGMYARKFLESARDDCSIVVHEPSVKIFRTALEYFDMSDLFANPRFRLVFFPLHAGNTVKSVYEDIMSFTDVGTYAGANYLNYADLFTDECVAYIEGLGRAKSFAIANQTVHDRFGGDYNRNVFNNLAFLRDSYSLKELAADMPEDIPAIVVAAGPSLDKNIKELARAKGKCILISTDTAMKPLSLAGIVPDIAAMADGKKDERYLSEADSRQVPLVCTAKCGNEFLSLHTGKKFFFDDSCYHLNGFIDKNAEKLHFLATGGSVANTCFSLARLFGCRRIILVGQDLAYTGDKTHSAVTVRGEKKTAVADLENVEMDVDINGDPIRSSREFMLYREWFEQKIDEDGDLDVVDATEGGVRIRGTKLMTLRDAIDEYCTKDFDFSETLKRAVPLFDEETKKAFDAYVRQVPSHLGDLRRMIRETAADYSSMRHLVQTDNYHTSRMKKLYDDCRKKTERIESSPVIEYVHNQMQGKSSELLSTVNKLENDEKKELLTVCDIGENYLRDMSTAIDELEPYMEIIKREFGG